MRNRAYTQTDGVCVVTRVPFEGETAESRLNYKHNECEEETEAEISPGFELLSYWGNKARNAVMHDEGENDGRKGEVEVSEVECFHVSSTRAIVCNDVDRGAD